MIDLDELERLAKDATPGPWKACDYGSYDGKDEGWYVDTSADRADIAPDAGDIQPNHWNAARGGCDMRFIAAANPTLIIDLIAEVRRLQNTEALILSYVAALLSNNVERAGDATRRMTDYALDHAAKESK